MKRICTKCGLEKDIGEFSWSIWGIIRHSSCKACRAAERSDYYKRNKEKELTYKWNRQQRKREEARTFVTEYLKSHPCVDYGQTDFMVLTFHHIRGKKKMDISQMVNQGYSIDTIYKEIDLCEVRCGNCHIRIEKQRRGTKYS